MFHLSKKKKTLYESYTPVVIIAATLHFCHTKDRMTKYLRFFPTKRATSARPPARPASYFGRAGGALIHRDIILLT
jgi:hypothetical protein